MKYAALLSETPPGLARFKLAFPEQRSWRVFHQEHRGAYDELISALEERQRGICAFCEISLYTDTPTPARQVEHWRPKSLDISTSTNFTFDAYNFHAACLGGSAIYHQPPFRIGVNTPEANLSCGQKKENFDPEGCHPKPYRPSELPIDAILVSYSIDGTVSSSMNAAESGYDPLRIEATISYLGLNCERLVQARKEIMAYLDSRFFEHYQAAEPADEDEKTSYALAEVAKEMAWWDEEPLPRFVTMLRSYVGIANDNYLLTSSSWAAG